MQEEEAKRIEAKKNEIFLNKQVCIKSRIQMINFFLNFFCALNNVILSKILKDERTDDSGNAMQHLKT